MSGAPCAARARLERAGKNKKKELLVWLLSGCPRISFSTKRKTKENLYFSTVLLEHTVRLPL